eukprot:IDg3399t1
MEQRRALRDSQSPSNISESPSDETRRPELHFAKLPPEVLARIFCFTSARPMHRFWKSYLDVKLVLALCESFDLPKRFRDAFCILSTAMKRECCGNHLVEFDNGGPHPGLYLSKEILHSPCETMASLLVHLTNVEKLQVDASHDTSFDVLIGQLYRAKHLDELVLIDMEESFPLNSFLKACGSRLKILVLQAKRSATLSDAHLNALEWN